VIGVNTYVELGLSLARDGYLDPKIIGDEWRLQVGIIHQVGGDPDQPDIATAGSDARRSPTSATRPTTTSRSCTICAISKSTRSTRSKERITMNAMAL